MVISALAIGGIALSGTGMFMGFEGANKKQEAATQQAALSQQELELEQQQIQLQYQRFQRGVVRQSIQQRAQAKTVATASGSQRGSGLPGAYGSLSGSENNSLLQGAQNFQMSQEEVGLKKAGIGPALLAGEGAYEQSIGGGLTSLGGSLISNLGNFNSIGKQFGFKMTT